MASSVRVYPADNGVDRFTPGAYSASVGHTIAVIEPGGGYVYGHLLAVTVADDGSTATLELDTGPARHRNDLDQIPVAQP